MHSLTSKSILCILICFVSGMAMGFISAPGEWFAQLNKPSWQPPNWLFGPVWSVLYVFMGIAVARVWHAESSAHQKTALTLFIIQFILNLMWSPIFFRMQNIGLAFTEILLLLLCLIATLFHFRKIDKLASYLLLPYLGWVLFATGLNGTIWMLNS